MESNPLRRITLKNTSRRMIRLSVYNNVHSMFYIVFLISNEHYSGPSIRLVHPSISGLIL